MAQYPTLWFLRHGQTAWNRAYRLQGQLDSPLTAQGVADARRQAALMPVILAQSPAIFVSPLGRARATADIALSGTAYDLDDRLKEIHAGDWQGMLRGNILAARPTWAAQDPSALEIYDAAPKGEGIVAFRTRILEFLADLRGPTVIVAHGLLGQVLRAHVKGLPPAAAGTQSNLQGCIYHLENGQETVLGAPR